MPTCELTWRVVDSSRLGDLFSAEAISANNVWAVGAARDGSMALHWDGQQWTRIHTPNLSDTANVLLGVSAISANDIWAAGYYYTGNVGVNQTLILHWDGSTWSAVPSPNIGGSDNNLHSVTALAPDDVWTVGEYVNKGNNGIYETLILHWDGISWTRVPSPTIGSYSNFLRKVAAVSRNDIWAVGTYYRTEQSYSGATLVLHWDGNTWSRIDSPNFGGLTSELNSVSVLTANDIWAVGEYETSQFMQPLTEHWDGAKWSIVPSPEVGKYFALFNDITAIKPNDVWAVGYYNTRTNLTEHWDGTKWSVVDSPSIGKYDALNAVAAVSATDVWTVGHYEANVVLYVHYSNECATPTPLPTETATATSTPACMLTFTDVPQDHPFYTFIRCLACRGIISGYSDNTFRPGNEITRGQIAKMVSNAAGFQEEPGPQVFEDVDSTNIFYTWINRLSNRGYMAGYPCGSVVGEPCNPPGNRPYFRPVAFATRGQLAKIVANAAGIGGMPTGLYYTDVEKANTFYMWIMRLTNLGVMSGYECGGPGEPCDDQQRPYFRPLANVTRGQASKIVANTFYPDCQTPIRH